MLVINLYGGPGSGKSTTAAGVFYKLKLWGINAELVSEYAKDLVYEGRLAAMCEEQDYILAEQHKRIFRNIGKVDVVVTDSPLMLSTIYIPTHWELSKKAGYIDAFKSLVKSTNDQYNNLNFFLDRPNKYDSDGRAQTHEEAIQKDNEILEMLEHYEMEYQTFKTDAIVCNEIVDVIRKEFY